MTAPEGTAVPLEIRAEVGDLVASYVDAIDDDDLERWPTLFVADCSYRVVPRSNHDRGLPLATMRCDSRAMLEDRVHALRHTAFTLPRRVRHVVGPLSIAPTGHAGWREAWRVRASYSLFETLVDQPTHILSVGEYRDVVVRDDDGVLRFAEKLCLNDSELVPNSLAVPL